MRSTGFAAHVKKPNPRAPINVPLSKPLPGRRHDMVQHHGTFTFALDPIKQVERFLILGTNGGTYYASEKAHTMQAFDALLTAIAENPEEVLDLACRVSDEGRAKSNDQALFVLAAIMAHGNDSIKRLARERVREIARIGTHVLHLAEFHKILGKGWGKSSKKLFQQWFLQQSAQSLGTNAVKFFNRDGWTLRDLLRLSHPYGTEEQNLLFKYMTKSSELTSKEFQALPKIVQGAHLAKQSTDIPSILRLIKEYQLPREALPTECLNNYKVWEALLPHMGITALIRNLGKISSLAMTQPFDDNVKYIVSQLTDAEVLSKGRVHPITLLNAQRTYASGQGMRGSNSWTPNKNIVAALEDAFYKSFNFQEPSGANILLAIDCSASMTWSKIAGTLINPREASAVLAMVTAKKEPNHHIMGFAGELIDLDINNTDKLADVVNKIARTRAGNTRVALPMEHAYDKKWKIDCFQVYTDNETNVGPHPSAALKKYREAYNRQAKLAVFGMTSTGFTVADPKDPGMLDFVGFDSGAPQAAAEFVKMRI